METSDWIAISALVVAVISLGVSLWAKFVDRVRVKTSLEYLPANEYKEEPELVVKIVNAGRRPAIIRSLGGDLEEGGSCETYLGEKEHGLRLTENAFSEHRITRRDIYVIAENLDTRYLNLWFQDSLGRRHKVKGSDAAIERLLKDWGDII